MSDLLGLPAEPDRLRVVAALVPGARTTAEVVAATGLAERIPAARAKRRVVLDHLARGFEPGVRYPERGVYAALRRYLVDEGFLERAAGIYWRTGGTVEL